MNPITLGTLLNTAPAIIQGASKLIDLIKERKGGSHKDKAGAVTPDNLGEVVERLEARLDAADEANVEQVKLIEQLARQNEMLTTCLRQILRRFTLIFILAALALLLAILALMAN